MFDENLLLLIVAGSAIVIISIWTAIRKRRREHPLEANQVKRSLKADNFEIDDEQIRRFKDENRILNVEREALEHAVSYLYKAEADGKITNRERNVLLEGYRQKIIQVEKAIDKNRLIASLKGIIRKEGVEVEELMKGRGEEDLEKSGRGEFIEEEVAKPTLKKTSEERIEEIREEVLKTLDKLDKMDIEG